MNVSVTYAQLKTMGGLAGANVRYTEITDDFRAICSLSGHPEVYVYGATSKPNSWALDFPLAVQVDAIDL